MIERQKIIFREIISNYFGTTWKELAELVFVGEKTVRADVKLLEDELVKLAGVRFVYDNDRISIPFDQKNEYLKAYMEIVHHDVDEQLSHEQEDRETGIVIELVDAEGYISMEELADRFSISKASIHPLVHEIESFCIDTSCGELLISSRKGVSFIGSEAERRMLLARYFSKRKNLRVINKYLNSYIDEDLQHIALPLAEVLTSFLKEKGIVLSDNDMYLVLMNTLISAQRIRNGHKIENKNKKVLKLYQEYATCLRDFGLSIETNELSYIPFNDRSHFKNEHGKSYQMVVRFLEAFNKRYNTNFHLNEDMNALMVHIDDILEHGETTSPQGSFIYEKMLNIFLCSFLTSGSLYKEIEDELGHEISAETRCYLALYVHTLVRNESLEPAHVLFFEPNMAMSSLTKKVFENHYGNQIKVTVVRNRWEMLEELPRKKYRLVISTKSIPIFFDGIPFQKISMRPTETDFNNIEKIIALPMVINPIDCEYNDDKSAVIINGKVLPLIHATHRVKGFDLICSESKDFPLGVYRVTNAEVPTYVMNYDMSSPYVEFNHMVNDFGRQFMKD